MSLHEDRLQSFKYTAKFLKLLIIALYKLWVGRCSLIHTQVTNEVVVEEYNDFKVEVIKVTESEEAQVLASINRIKIPMDVENISALQLRG